MAACSGITGSNEQGIRSQRNLRKSGMSLLDPSAEEIRRWGNAAVDVIAEYLGGLRDRPLYPDTTAAEIRARLNSLLPRGEGSFDELLGVFQTVVLELSRHNAHPRMFGYVQSPGTFIGAIADLLASVLNANLTAWRSAPVA